MLQQTQVSRVLKKFPEFIAAFPDFTHLAHAPQAKLLSLWQGMGYNRRALWLKKAAHMVVEAFGNKLPTTPQELKLLPGIGPNTAGSIAAFAYNYPSVFIETNIRRVYIFHWFKDKDQVPDKDILELVEKTLDANNPRVWYWALMDYGAYLATVVENPNKKSRHYTRQGTFKGSRREVRGKILAYLLKNGASEAVELAAAIPTNHSIQEIIWELIKEGFLKERGGKVYVE